MGQWMPIGNNMIKIAFFDIDGTLLQFGHKDPSPKTVQTLQKLQEHGVLICMASGRGYCQIPHFEGVEFDVYLTFNGSYVVNSKEVIRSTPMDRNDVQIILRNLREMNRPASISNEKILVANGMDDDLAEYFDFGNTRPLITPEFDEISKRDIYQMMCACREEEYERVLKGTSNTRIASWWDRAVDIIPSCAGKGAAVKSVLDYYGILKEEAIAFGDGGNDIEMFEAVGTGVAMGNAGPEVKAKADVVCDSVENDGIYKFVECSDFIPFLRKRCSDFIPFWFEECL